MSLSVAISIVLVGCLAAFPSCGQGFVNLTFEAANVSAYGSGPAYVPITEALPGWKGYLGSFEVGNVFYNTRALDMAAISLHSVGSDSFQPIHGSYSVFLQGSSWSTPPQYTSGASLAQTGTLPSDAKSLRFAVGPISGGYGVSFAGQGLAPYQIASGASYVVLAADVSSFAGQAGELRFTVIPHGYLYFDDVSFSSTPIPEPSGAALLGLGFAALAWQTRRKRFA